MAEAESLYTALNQTKDWDEPAAEDTKVVAFATEVKKLRKENNRLKSASNPGGGVGQGNPKAGSTFKDKLGNEVAGPPGTTAHGILKWRTVKKGNQVTMKGKLYEWCPLHFEGKGLYMTCNSADGKSHDHAAWKENKKQAKKKRRDAASPGVL